MSQVVTGEAVAIDLRVARLGSRTVAALLDAVVQVVAMVVLLLALRPVIEASDPALVAALVLLVYVVGIVGYPGAFEALWRGQTPGKVAMGLRVVRDDGGPIRFRQALVRGLVGAVAER
ncbi:MAG TPA: RDD family protein, partial [Frankiaceae bacterium]|nr:RDD family protein [Frankiaceae bacterium]